MFQIVQDGQTHGILHWTDKTHSILLVTHSHSLEEDTRYHARPHGGYPRNQREPARAMGDRLCSNKRIRCPWFLKRI